MKQYLIGIDIGTSGTKAVLFDTEGEVVASASAEYPMHQPANGLAEENPEDWWNAAAKTLKAVTAKAADGNIAAIGLSGQMHSLVLLDKDNRVIRPAILWCDQRTKEECREIEEIVGRERLIAVTGNPAMPAFTASKLLWVKKHEPQSYARCAHILLAKDYIRFRLTGEYASEVSDASGMQLLDLNRRQWSEEICSLLGIDMALLPTVRESPEISGYVHASAADETGLPIGLPVAGGAGDNAAAAIGTGVVSPGKAFTTIGTSGVIFTQTERPTVDYGGRIHTFCAAIPYTWHVLGTTQAAGLSLSWFRKQFAGDLSYSEIDDAARRIPIGCERLIYLPFLMGERTPILDSDARGVFFGLSPIHTRDHLARAVIEGVSFSLYSCYEVFREIGIRIDDMILCGGGGKSPFWQQMLADVYDAPISTTIGGEAAALGVAILGGCAAGIYASVEEGCRRTVRKQSTLLPRADEHQLYLRYYEIYRSLYPALRAEYKALAAIQTC